MTRNCWKVKFIMNTILIFLACLNSAANAQKTGHISDDGSLFLTPLLDKDDITTARALSVVKLNKLGSKLHSHAGFITVEKQLGNHLFFWHFASQQNKKAPLLMWLNGGPTVSSMLGLLWEHGPLAVDEKFVELYVLRNHTWVGPFSVVYVDNPVGTGYSYSEKGEEGYRLTQEGYTQDLYNFVLQFFKLFPEYKNREFYIGGQSYAGKYVPALAHRIHEQRHNECREVPLTGIMLGGPYFDPPTQDLAFFDFLYALGLLSFADLERNIASVKTLYHTLLNDYDRTYTFSEIFINQTQASEIPSQLLDNYVTGKPAGYPYVHFIMASPEIRQAVHVGRNRSFCAANSKLQDLYGPDAIVSTKPQMAVLMDNYKVLVYNGDYDVVVSSIMIEAALITTNWSMQEQYNKTKRHIWRKCGRIKGYYSQTGKFCRVVVRGAGHQTPHDMPDTSLEMVTDFLNHGCIKQEVGSAEICLEIDKTRNRNGCGMLCSYDFKLVYIFAYLLSILYFRTNT